MNNIASISISIKNPADISEESRTDDMFLELDRLRYKLKDSKGLLENMAAYLKQDDTPIMVLEFYNTSSYQPNKIVINALSDEERRQIIEIAINSIKRDISYYNAEVKSMVDKISKRL